MIGILLFVSSLSGGAVADTPAAETATPSPDRIICRSRPVLGSRISRQRICKTADEWRAYENDLEQSRRDINDRGARGCGASTEGC